MKAAEDYIEITGVVVNWGAFVATKPIKCRMIGDALESDPIGLSEAIDAANASPPSVAAEILGIWGLVPEGEMRFVKKRMNPWGD